jgi:hypothetical protein
MNRSKLVAGLGSILCATSRFGSERIDFEVRQPERRGDMAG